jgi:hypothetical protein
VVVETMESGMVWDYSAYQRACFVWQSVEDGEGEGTTGRCVITPHPRTKARVSTDTKPKWTTSNFILFFIFFGWQLDMPWDQAGKGDRADLTLTVTLEWGPDRPTLDIPLQVCPHPG